MAMVLVCMAFSLQMQAGDERFYVYNATNGLADNSAQTILLTTSGRLVITTMGQINFYDGSRFSYIDPSMENIYPLPNYKGNYHIYFDRTRHLWLKNAHTLSCVDVITERFTDSIEEEFEKFGCHEPVLDLFVDQTEVLWLLTEKGVYNVATKKTFPVRRNLNLQDLEVWNEKCLMLFYDNGLMEMTSMDTGKVVYEGKPYDDADGALYANTSVQKTIGDAVFQIRNGVGAGILMRFDIQHETWKTLLKTPYYLSNIAEHDSIVYVPSAYGYWTYDMKTEHVEHVEMLTMAQGPKLLTDINAMAFDQQGGMWVGTEKRGLLYSRPQPSPFKVYTWETSRALELGAMMDQLPDPKTTYRDHPSNCVYRDSRGWEWVGTSSGLQLYRRSTDRLPVVYTRNDGLLNNVIHTIIEDNLHNIWVGTSYGISCLLIQDNKIRHITSYNQWDNIPSESFVNGKAMRMRDGTIVMQMLDHVIEFNPKKMVTITEGVAYDITPKLIRVMVNGNNLHTGEELDGNVILDMAIPRMKEINLNYNQNSATLTFSAMNYFRPQQTFYRVRIQGLDDTWRVLATYNSGGMVDSRGLLHLPLVALKPGSYTIQLQTSMIPDVWKTEPYEWVVNVNEPWWRTRGVMWLFTLLLIVLLAINAYYYMRNVSMRATRNSHEQGIVRQIRNFAEHCSQQEAVLLEPVPEEYSGVETSNQNALTPEFIATMENILPTVLKKDTEKLTMRELSVAAKMELQQFYQVILGNIFKSPRPLAKSLMLKKAEELLTTTEKDLDQIASECGFVSPNYFIAAFYRKNKVTPEIYRRQNSYLRKRM
jgi:AraC-like DNA-binding protein